MNRSIFIVIVDFLLLSLIAFARFDSDEVVKKKDVQAAVRDASGSENDMVDVLKLSLEEERLAREKLNDQLGQTQDTLRTREESLADREKRLRDTQENLTRKEDEARRLDTERTTLQQRLSVNQTNLAVVQQQFQATRANLDVVQQQYSAARTNLATVQQQYETARGNIATLQQQYEATRSNAATLQQQLSTTRSNAATIQQQLTTTSSETKQTKERLEAIQAELRKREEEAALAQRKVQELEKSRQAAETEKQKIAGQLQVAETEKRMTREQLEVMRGEVQVVREEKAKIQQQATKLAENVGTLADKSEKLTEEIRQNRPLTPNTIFNEFNSNRVQTVFQAGRSGIFGQAVNKQQEAKTILVSHGSQIYAIYHLEDTPLSFTAIGTEWERLTGTLRRDAAVFSIGQLSFLDRDPRILVVPVGEPQARALGCKIYPVSPNPYKFQEAVLVGGAEGYYGECQFQIEPETPNYVKMQRERFSRLVGKFLPSRGDLVFSKTGELLGVMANKEYCVMLDDLKASRTIRTGDSILSQQPAQLLSQMYNRVLSLPFRLQ